LQLNISCDKKRALSLANNMAKMKSKKVKVDLSETGYCVSFNFRRASRVITSLYELALKRAGIRSTGFTILIAIAKSEPIAIGALARAIVLDPTTMTRSLRLLQRQKLVAVSGRSSNRQRFVTLLPKGTRALARGMPVWRQIQRRFVNKIGPDTWKELQGELERIAGVAMELKNSASKV